MTTSANGKATFRMHLQTAIRVAARIAALLGLGGMLALAPAHAQEKTPANAFEFIRSVMSDGSWEGQYEYCDQEYEYDELIWEDCSTQWAPVQHVYYYDNTYCAITFQMAAEDSPVRKIDLRKQFDIVDWGGLNFNGPVVKSNGEVTGSWRTSTTNYDAHKRVLAAVQYLRDICKPNTGPW